jgi:hypothetical protein
MKNNNHQNTTLKKNLKKTSRNPFNTIQDIMGWKTVRMSDELIQKLCDFLLDWANRKDSVSITSGLLEFGIPSYTYYDWMEQSEMLKIAHREVKERIGENMLKLAMFRGCDPSFVHPRLSLYHKDFLEVQRDERAFRLSLADRKLAIAKESIQNLLFVGNSIEKTELVDNVVKRAKNNRKTE